MNVGHFADLGTAALVGSRFPQSTAGDLSPGCVALDDFVQGLLAIRYEKKG
jgi:hypothetical protein